jgi:hypothetical protein
LTWLGPPRPGAAGALAATVSVGAAPLAARRPAERRRAAFSHATQARVKATKQAVGKAAPRTCWFLGRLLDAAPRMRGPIAMFGAPWSRRKAYRGRPSVHETTFYPLRLDAGGAAGACWESWEAKDPLALDSLANHDGGR